MADRRKVAIRESGDATTDGGGFANSGNFQGDVYQVLPQPPARSAYLQTVRRIAPKELIGRQAELRKLEGVCTSTDAAGYLYWQAPAWAGKSALMSFFVLHPPAGVRISSFFITARFSSQSDRRAFIHVMVEQLAEVAKLPMPVLTEINEEAHFLEKLDQAAAACRRQGQRLVLVVDGLDEDRGVVIGSEMYSIAALLPAQLSDNVQIVVAGRPDPPIPSDVPDGHPLRDPGIVIKLDVSPRAQVIRADAERELRGLLHGTQAQQDLLGLVAAAGGGLSGRDLAELSGLDSWEIEEYLHTVSGRTFATREGIWHSEVIYVLAHEELQKTSLRYLAGGRLKNFRERLYSWADGYRQKGWPIGTPEYLLGGYYRLLQEGADQDRMVICALDEARHNRMLDVTGGDADALSEITAAHRMVASRSIPDLLASLRLAKARHRLKDRNRHIPENLPGVWAKLGYSARGEALARSISDPYQQTQAFIALTRAECREKGLAPVRHLIEQAEQIARTINSSHQRARALADLSRVVAMENDLDWAERITRTIPNSYQRAQSLADLAEIAVEMGNLGWAMETSGGIPDAEHQVRAYVALVGAMVEAGTLQQARHIAREVQQSISAIPDAYLRVRLLGKLAEALAKIPEMDWACSVVGHAEELINEIRYADQKSWALASLASTFANCGDRTSAQHLVEQAEHTARTIPNTYERTWAVGELVKSIISIGEFDKVEEVVRIIIDPQQQAHVLTDVVRAAGDRGEVERADRIARALPQAEQRARCLGIVARVMANLGDAQRAYSLIHEAEQIVATVADPVPRAHVIAELAEVMVDLGEMDGAYRLTDQAEQVARTIANPIQEAQALTSLAEAIASGGDLDRAEHLSWLINSPKQKAWVLGGLVKLAADLGYCDRAERVAHTIADAVYRAEVLANLADTMAAKGQVERAERLAHTIGDSRQRARALIALLVIAINKGDMERARRLVDQAENLLLIYIQPVDQAWYLSTLSEAVAHTGNLDRATQLACAIEDDDQRSGALDRIAQACADSGDLVRAEQLVDLIDDAYRKARALVSLVELCIEFGEIDKAYGLAGRAEQVINTATQSHPYRQTMILSDLVVLVARIGDYDRAELIARSLSVGQGTALFDIVKVLTANDELGRAERLTRTISDPQAQVQAVALLIKDAAGRGQMQRARELIAEAAYIAKDITPPYLNAWALTDLVEVASDIGEVDLFFGLIDEAELASNAIGDVDDQSRALAGLAKTASHIGCLDRAEQIAYTIADVNQRAGVLEALSSTAAVIGDPDRAERIAKTITNVYWQARALITITRHVDSVRGRQIVARGLLDGPWWLALGVLVEMDRITLISLADDFLSAE